MNMIMSGECGAFNPLLLKCLYEISPKLRMVVEGDMGEETYRQEADRLAADVMKKKSMPCPPSMDLPGTWSLNRCCATWMSAGLN